MKPKCKTCNKNCEGDYCFKHKPSQLKSRDILFYTSKQGADIFNKAIEMQSCFILIWNSRAHKSEVSGTYLGNEPLTTFFHHILPKSKYPEARLDEENIILLTADEHASVEQDAFKYEEVNKRRNQLKIKYGIL